MKMMNQRVAVVVLIVLAMACPAFAARIRDVTRLKNDVPNELVGMGIVVGLKGTGDGGDFMPAMRPLKEMMKRFDNPVMLEKELKNANNVAIVTLSARIPPEGAHEGTRLDVQVSAVAAKSLRGGRLFIVPLFAPRTDVRIIKASASGEIVLDDDTMTTDGVIRGGAVLIEDVLPDLIKDGRFTLVINQNMANAETATAIADCINEEASAQTGGKAIAQAIDGTSVDVAIPAAELHNVTPFVSRIRTLKLPDLSVPAKVLIDKQSKSIIFTDEVELSPTTVEAGGVSVTIGAMPGTASLTGGRAATASMQDLENAFNLLRVTPDDRIRIVQRLQEASAISAPVEIR